MKEKEIDKDTVVAYHDFIQGQIRGELNGIFLGPGRIYALSALVIFIFGLASGIVGILVVTLRTRHVYLVQYNADFLGPFFVMLFLMCTGFAIFLVLTAKRRANRYRSELVFRPIGDYGVAVVHKSRLTFEQTTKETLKSGTAPHKPINAKPYQPVSYRNQGRPPPQRGVYENRGYRDPPPRYEDDRRRPPDDRRRPPDDHRRYGPPDDHRRHGPPDDRRRYGPPDDRRRYGPPDDRRRPPPDDRRRPPADDRYRDPRDRYADPPRDPEKRRMYEEERRRRYEEEKRMREERGETPPRETQPRLEKPPLPQAYRVQPGAPRIKLDDMEEADESTF